MSEVRKSMRLLFTVLFFIALVCSSICISPLYAEDITEIVVFGDSLCDTGNLYAFTTDLNMSDPDEKVIPPPSPYWMGRFSNERVWVEYLAWEMGVIEEEDGLWPSNLGGTNYAWGGAETGDGISQRNTPNIGVQINSFLASGNQPNENQLIIIWAGANDFHPVDEDTPLPRPSDIVDNIIEHIRTLALAAPHENLKFMIPNLPPLGLTPGAQCLGSDNPIVPWILNGLSIRFNNILNRKLEELKIELEKQPREREIIFYKLNIFRLFLEMNINPPDPITNVNDTVRIGTNESGCPLEVTDPGEAVVEEEADGYLFFDSEHPTTVAHEIIANRAFELIQTN